MRACFLPLLGENSVLCDRWSDVKRIYLRHAHFIHVTESLCVTWDLVTMTEVEGSIDFVDVVWWSCTEVVL